MYSQLLLLVSVLAASASAAASESVAVAASASESAPASAFASESVAVAAPESASESAIASASESVSASTPASASASASATAQPGSDCPAIWGTVASDLKTNLFSTCNDPARAAIRLPFHDCYAGACDGSIILSDECTTRPENTQLGPICDTLGGMATQYNVSVADLIQVAGAIAVAQCPPSPTITVKVGRKDSSTANPTPIPGPDSKAADLVAEFAAKGFTSEDLVALIGAHSAGKTLTGEAFDSTVDSLDSEAYYGEVLDGTAPAILPSDLNLATDNATKDDWIEYRDNQTAWNVDFARAFEKMAVLGVDASALVDCTSMIFAEETD